MAGARSPTVQHDVTQGRGQAVRGRGRAEPDGDVAPQPEGPALQALAGPFFLSRPPRPSPTPLPRPPGAASESPDGRSLARIGSSAPRSTAKRNVGGRILLHADHPGRRRRGRRRVRPDRRPPRLLRGLRGGRLRPGSGRAHRRGGRRPTLRRRPGGRLRPRLGRRAGPRARRHPRDERGRPAVRDADLRRRVRGGRGLPGHGDVPVPARRGAAVRQDRPDARRRAVRRGRPVGAGRPAGPGRDGGRAGAVRRVRPLRRRRPVLRDRRARHPGRLQPDRRRLRLRAVVLDLDHDRGVPQPAGDLGGRPRLVRHRAVQRAGGLRLPRRHRAGRVRERRARGGDPDAALGRGQAGHLQVRPRARSSSTCCARCASSAWTRPRRCPSAAPRPAAGGGEGAGQPAGPGRRLPARPGVPRRQDARRHLRRRLGDRHRARTARRARCTSTTWSTTHETDARVRRPVRGLADRGQPGGRAGAAGHRRLVGHRRARSRGVRAQPFLDLLAGAYGSPWGMEERTPSRP